MIDTVSIQDRAKEAASWFETAQRAAVKDGQATGELYVRVKDGAPEWVTELVRAAHYGVPDMLMLPDDFRYQVIREAVDALAEDEDTDEHDFADGVDVYTSDLTAWLGSHSLRPGYCDEWKDDHGANEDGIVSLIQGGQYMERREVFGLVRQALEGAGA